jgi:hypothetical protein
MFEAIRDFFERIFGGLRGTRSEEREIPIGQISPIHPNVLVVIYNPFVPSEGDRRLSEVFGWHNPSELVHQYIADIRDASNGYCIYEVIEQLEINDLPVKEDGFSYTVEGFVSAWRARSGFHEPDRVDYHYLVRDLQLIDRIDSDQIDEAWLFAPPYAGFYESRMVGPGAFWCNAPPLEGYQHASRRFVIMGFNYERGVGEMLESFGHRAESIMSRVFRRQRGDDNLWERFIRYDLTNPGEAEVGNVHFAPNSTKDYDWGNRNYVPSSCDNWYNFPDLGGLPRQVNCSEWGNGDTRLHHLWWLKHFPHIDGSFASISYNWWEYIIDPERVH